MCRLTKLSAYRFITAIFALYCLHSCQSEERTTRSFCYWKTSFDLSHVDDSLRNCLKVNHFYLRLFDVDWNPYENEAQPVGSVDRWWHGNLGDCELTPTVFITNTVMEKSSTEQLDSLAVRIKTRINTILNKYASDFAYQKASDYVQKYQSDYYFYGHIRDSITPIARKDFFKRAGSEILIDCDWSEKSRNNYFYFLDQMKKRCSGSEIAATLRLWQFKYREKAGIPPVNRCLLMCYNMQNPGNYEVNNSIGSTSEIAKYITNATYPKSLDVALPLFGWAVLYRGKTYKGLISDSWFREHAKDTALLHLYTPNHYQFVSDQVIGNTYVRYGDELRTEQISPKELGDIVRFIKQHLSLESNARITFFAWDTAYIQQYGVKNLTSYYRMLHK